MKKTLVVLMVALMGLLAAPALEVKAAEKKSPAALALNEEKSDCARVEKDGEDDDSKRDDKKVVVVVVGVVV